MAINRMSLLDLIHKTGVKGDFAFLREGLKVLAQAIMELEVAEKTSAERYERSEKRITSRNGYRSRELDTRAGTLEFPSCGRGATSRAYWNRARRQSKR